VPDAAAAVAPARQQVRSGPIEQPDTVAVRGAAQKQLFPMVLCPSETAVARNRNFLAMFG